MSVKVAISQFEYRKAADFFNSIPDFEFIVAPSAEDELAEAIRSSGARHAVIGTVRYAKALYEALPPGGVIARFGVGHDGVDKAAAARHGLFCTNTPGVLEQSVAEFTIGMMISFARHLSVCSHEVRTGGWHNRVGGELAGKTLLIVGCGEIGARTARIAALGLHMRVLGLARRAQSPTAESGIARIFTEFEPAAHEADFISLHIPDSPENRDFINAGRLKQMKPSAVLINTARGGVVDENALYDAVAAGTIAGAALDVFKHEPYVPLDPARDLRKLDRMLLTPHLGSSTAEACLRVAQAVVDNLRAAEAGQLDRMNLVTG